MREGHTHSLNWYLLHTQNCYHQNTFLWLESEIHTHVDGLLSSELRLALITFKTTRCCLPISRCRPIHQCLSWDILRVLTNTSSMSLLEHSFIFSDVLWVFFSLSLSFQLLVLNLFCWKFIYCEVTKCYGNVLILSRNFNFID